MRDSDGLDGLGGSDGARGSGDRSRADGFKGTVILGSHAIGTDLAEPGAAMADNPGVLDECFSSVAPTPVPGNPYLQSGRLGAPATGGSVGLNKSLLDRMDATLKELKIPKRPIPTKRVCDVYDSVRKDVLTLWCRHLSSHLAVDSSRQTHPDCPLDQLRLPDVVPCRLSWYGCRRPRALGDSPTGPLA